MTRPRTARSSSPSAAPRRRCAGVRCCGPSSPRPAEPRRRIAVVPSASSLGPEVVEVYRAVFTALGAARGGRAAPDEPRRGRRPGPGRAAGRGRRGVHDRRQPAQAERLHHRHPVRRRRSRRVRARGRGRRHVGRGQHPGRAHDRLRLGRRDAPAADEPAVRRARAAPRRGRRPALRAAQPVRPAALPGRPVARPAGHGGRRGHGGGGRRRDPARGGRPRRGDRGRRAAPGRPTRTRPSAPRRCWCPGRCCTCCRPAASSTWPRRTLVAHQTPVPDHEVVEARAAEADLRALAEEIAAEGVSPAHYARRVRRRLPGLERTVQAREPPSVQWSGTSAPEEPKPRSVPRRTPPARPDDRLQPGLPGPERLALRAGDPAGGRPRGAGGLPHQQAARLRRRAWSSGCPGWPTTPAAAAGAAGSSSGCTRAPGSATSPSTSPCSCSSRSATTCGAARPAQVKGVRGRYNVIYAYSDESVGLAAGELAVRLVNDLVRHDPEFDFEAEPRALHRPRRADRVRPVHPGHRRGGGQPGHPLPPAEHRLAGPARPGRARQADPGHHDLADLLGRGGHRQQQGADPQPAGRGRAAGAAVGVGAHAWTTPSGWPTGSATRWCSSRWTATTAAG